MKPFPFVVAALASLCLCFAGVADAVEGSPTASMAGGGDGKTVVARVNGVGITEESLAVMMNSPGKKKGHGQASPASPEETRTEALNQLILQELAYQKAKSEGLGMEPKEVDGVLEEMRRKSGSEEKFKEQLEKERITEGELRNRIERNFAIRRIFTREIQNKVSVPKEEIRQEYEKEKEKYARPEKIAVIDVVFFLDPGAAGSRKKAEEILGKIHEDKEKDPWNLASDTAYAVREMEIKGGQGRELYEAAKKLNVGELSDVFDAEETLHIIKLVEYTPRRQSTFEEVKGKLEAGLRFKAMKKRMEEWGVELRRNANIEIVETGGNKKRGME
jgi:parvulin-like peptidyl-prolyl isomerase